VDVQNDFLLPGGRLYVPGAEKLIPNTQRLIDVVRKNGALLISSGDKHAPDDPEFEVYPPHCVRGTIGADVIPEGLAQNICTVPNDSMFQLPHNLLAHHQIFIEKQTLDVFENPHTEKILGHLPADAEFLVFGVVTELRVRCAAKGLLDRGRRVAIVTDAIELLDPAVGAGTEFLTNDLVTTPSLLVCAAKKNDNVTIRESGTPRGAGGLVSGAASKAVVSLVAASR
jgi:nicotinamidase/pyrazinamidase